MTKALCTIKDCKNTIEARGYCPTHYGRWYNNGSPYAVKYIKNNQVKHPLYSTFRGMHQRCENPNSKFYSYYGGKGINVDERWTGAYGFTNFLEDMGKRPKDYTLDRIDSSKGYSPDNCRWASRSVQQYNQATPRTNTSGYKGVSQFKATGKWQAYMHIGKKRKHLGYFVTFEEAVIARKTAEYDVLKELNVI